MMKKTNIAVCRPKLTALIISTLLGGPTGVWAEAMQQVPFNRSSDTSRWSDNYVELGGGYLDSDSNTRNTFKFGEWTGLSKEGGYGTLGFNYQSRARENDSIYFHTFGQNIGLDTFKFMLEGGKQGSVSLSAGGDRLTLAQSDSAVFLPRGLGSNNLTYAGSQVAWNAANRRYQDTNGAGAPISANLQPFDISQTRDIYRLNLAGVISNAWDFKVNVREDQREGTRVTSAYFTTPMMVPYQINDKTTQIDTTLSYTTKAAQAQLTYSYSQYDNDETALRWQNPFDPAATRRTGQASLMPSNEMHQISFTGALNLAKSSRLTTYLSQSINLQDAAFLPYTSNPATTLSNPTGTNLSTGAGLPRQSLDGKIINTIADIALTTRPVDAMNMKLAYQYRDSNNKTPTTEYRYVFLDSFAQPANNAASTARRVNVAISSTEHRYTLDTDYDVMSRTKLRGLLERKVTDYEYNSGPADVPSNTEDRILVELRRAISDEFTGALSLQHKERSADSYNKNSFFNASYPLAGPVYDTTTNAGIQTARYFTNNPQMRNFMYADYDEDRVRLNGQWNASETWSFQGGADAYQQKFDKMDCSGVASDPNVAAATAAVNASPSTNKMSWSSECLGRERLQGNTASLDAQWQPSEDFSAFAFYTYSNTKLKQKGRATAIGGSTPAAAAQPNAASHQVQVSDDASRSYFVDTEFEDQTIGLGLKWNATTKLELGSQYVFSRGTENISLALVPGSSITAFVSPLPLPENKSETQSLQLYGKWNFSNRFAFRLNYMYERFRASDWAWDNVPATGVNGVLLQGQQTPRYDNHYIGASVAFSTW